MVFGKKAVNIKYLILRLMVVFRAALISLVALISRVALISVYMQPLSIENTIFGALLCRVYYI